MRFGNGSVYSKAYGVLTARGSEACPITFTSNAAGTYWRGISFRWNPETACGPVSSLRYCIIEYGGEEDVYQMKGAVSVSCSNALLEHCVIRSSLHDGIHMNTTPDPVTSCYASVTGSHITGSQDNGINVQAGTGAGACFPVVEATEITANSDYGIYCGNGQCSPDIRSGNRVNGQRIISAANPRHHAH